MDIRIEEFIEEKAPAKSIFSFKTRDLEKIEQQLIKQKALDNSRFNMTVGNVKYIDCFIVDTNYKNPSTVFIEFDKAEYTLDGVTSLIEEDEDITCYIVSAKKGNKKIDATIDKSGYLQLKESTKICMVNESIIALTNALNEDSK